MEYTINVRNRKQMVDELFFELNKAGYIARFVSNLYSPANRAVDAMAIRDVNPFAVIYTKTPSIGRKIKELAIKVGYGKYVEVDDDCVTVW